MANVSSSLIVNLVDRMSGPAGKAGAAVDALSRDLQDISAKAAKVDAFRKGARDLDAAALAMKRAQQELKRLKGEIADADEPTAKMARALQQAERAAERSKQSFMTQGRAVRQMAQDLAAAGLPINKLADGEKRLKASIDATTAAMKKQATDAEAMAKRQAARQAQLAAGKGLAGAAVAADSYGAVRAGSAAVREAISADEAKARQRAYTGTTAETQNALLTPQAKRLGAATQFTNSDIYEAQTATMQGLPDGPDKAAIAAAITEHATRFAQALGTTPKASAEILRSFLLNTRQAIGTPDAAVSAAQKGANQAAWMAKHGGMSAEDVEMFLKYGASASTAAGMSPEALFAIGTNARRAGLRGDEAGVFMRSASAKLIAPTQKGAAALAAAGIDYDQYTAMPGGLSVETYEQFVKNKFGKALTEAQRQALSEALNNEDLIHNRGDFIAQTSEILAESFKGKSGKVAAKDANAIAKMNADYYKLSVQSVDVERLFFDLMKAIKEGRMTAAQANAIFTSQQGGRAMALAGNADQLAKDRESLRNVDPNFVKGIADEIMGGLYGAFENLKGSASNLALAFGEANAGLLTFGARLAGDVMDKLAEAPNWIKQALTGGGAALAVAGTAGAANAALAGGGVGAIAKGGLGGAGAAARYLGVPGLLLAPAAYAASVAAASNNAPAADIANTKLKELQQQLAAVEERLAAVQNSGRSESYVKTNAAPLLARREQLAEAIREQEEVLRAEAWKAGEAAGNAAGEGIAGGIEQQGPHVLSEALSLMDRTRAIFSGGVDVPVRFGAPAAAPSAPVPAAPAAPAPAPSPEKHAFEQRITVNVASVADPAQIGSEVEQRARRGAELALRGSFSDYA